MSISRRSLLQYGGSACALGLLGPAQAAAGSLRRYEVRDDAALPRFRRGDVVLADAGVTQFAGPGLYLYPAWGSPRLYAVHAAGAQLEFRNPGSGLLLWTQSADFAASFAGKAVQLPEAATIAAVSPDLVVPLRPT